MMIRSALATLIICLSVASLAAQKSVERWHRVYTGDDSLIEINLDSVSFADHVIRAQFRTIYSSPATLSNNSNVKYTTRIEDLGFKIGAKQYHLYETSLLDPTGKAVNQSKNDASDEWKVLKPGGMMDRLAQSVRELPPFGAWTVVAYRYADDVLDRTAGAPELVHFIGQRVNLLADFVQVNAKRCLSPEYESRSISSEELSRELGLSGRPLGITSTSVDMIIVKCQANGWPASRSFLLASREGNTRMLLWDGVFLVLKRE